MSPHEDSLRIGRRKVEQVFRYLEALNQHRNPAKRHLDDQLWRIWLSDLPDHPSIRIATFTTEQNQETAMLPAMGVAQRLDEDFVIKVRRPKLTQCPPAPDAIAQWLERGWEEPSGEVRVRQTRNQLDDEGRTVFIQFQADSKRLQALDRWRVQRDAWVSNEKPARAAMKVFEKLYELRGQIEREGEKIELVLGDGILSWKRPEGGVFHPILLQRLQLEFDPTLPEFSIVEAETPVELYGALFQSMPDVEGRVVARIRQELEQGKYHPSGKEDTSGFLRSVAAQLSPHGEFRADSAPRPGSEHPVIWRSRLIFLRQRTLGFAVALQSAIHALSAGALIPPSLLRVVGIESDPPSGDVETRPSSWMEEGHPGDVLLSKPANMEQIRIAQRLEEHGSVLVQGPPGTGKTHTIANLVGHLLAQGKSVLITSHATKALRVLRDHVVPQLRPLCVSLLDSDLESRKQLESSVDSIVDRLSRSNASQLEQQAHDFQSRRNTLVERHRTLCTALLNARSDEYREVVVGGRAYAPSEAARRVRAGIGRCDYIPGPVELNSALPLTEQALTDLYRTNVLVSPDDEVELSGRLPAPKQLPTPAEFDDLLTERTELSHEDISYRSELWSILPEDQDPSRLTLLAKAGLSIASQIRNARPWQLVPMLAGHNGIEEKEPWESLLALIQDVWECRTLSHDLLLQYEPLLPGDFSLEESCAISEEIYAHLDDGGSLSFLTLITRSTWKRYIRNSRVSSGEPRLPEHFLALRSAALLNRLRKQLLMRWGKQMAPLGAASADVLGPEPEAVCRQLADALRRCLDWDETEWSPLEAEIQANGLDPKKLLEEQPPSFGIGGQLVRLADLLKGPFQQVIAARLALIRWRSIPAKIKQWEEVLRGAGGDEQATGVVERLRAALQSFDSAGYGEAIRRLLDLYNRRKYLERRRELLTTLTDVAPGWSAAIATRSGMHGKGDLPPSVPDAWLWRQLSDELDRRASISLRELQDQLAQVSQDIQKVTAELIEKKAWAAQLRRTERNLQQKQALVGWLDIVKRMGKGTGIRVPRLKAEANRLMTQCRSAVPVWIMPLSRVAENFDPRTTHVDVVIIDEASQADVMGLLALFLADKAIVVGDHEQVSPSAVGQDLTVVQHLIDEFLEGIPNCLLYDGQMSIYDLARQSFGGTIRLLEHFRCVPEIIQFSNQLSYNGAIRPLRDTSNVALKPHVIAHRVANAFSHDKTNNEEAEEIAALVLAAAEQPEYAGKTFGVISLVGEEQAFLIDSQLRKNLSEEEFKLEHNILCGNPSHFQGDERDVVFLSVVDSSMGGVLRMREEQMFKQRFNVAASRARDQMWVVHSLDPRSHLKPGDLRRRLIEYAEDPQRVLKALESLDAKTESVFEKEVAAQLVRMGYRVVPQWRVGYYRIDLVVEGGGMRLAVECDGDRFHPLEKLPDDMARQAVLERLGWSFVRIRGSQFFRDPEGAIEPVLLRLRSLGIEPAEPTQSDESRDSSLSVDRELIDRVIRRAQEIRRRWRPSDKAAADTGSVIREPGSVFDFVRALPQASVAVSSAGTELDDGDLGDTDAGSDDVSELVKQPSLFTAGFLTKDVPAEDLRTAIYAALPEVGRIDREILVRKCAQSLGFVRLSKKLRSRINKTIGSEVRYGRLQKDAEWSYVWRNGSY